MYYSGESNVPGAPGNFSGTLIAAGIPVGQDPRFPMSQESFEQYVDERRLNPELQEILAAYKMHSSMVDPKWDKCQPASKINLFLDEKEKAGKTRTQTSRVVYTG
jgi:hypothetical protein